MKKKIFIVSKKNELFKLIISKYKHDFEIIYSSNIEEFNRNKQFINNETIIISFSHSIIFTEDIIKKSKTGYNIHAASPEYPGRDPHHWAVYSDAKTYGSTAHIITKSVDNGPIVHVELFQVPYAITPAKLLEMANNVAEKIVAKLIDQIFMHELPKENSKYKWGGLKKTRKDFQEICNIPIDISDIELEKRIKAFHNKEYLNLFIEISGHKFYLKI